MVREIKNGKDLLLSIFDELRAFDPDCSPPSSVALNTDDYGYFFEHPYGENVRLYLPLDLRRYFQNRDLGTIDIRVVPDNCVAPGYWRSSDGGPDKRLPPWQLEQKSN